MKKTILAMLLALPMTMFAQKIGHVNFETVIQGMSEYTAAQTEFQNLQKQLSEEMQRKQTEFQTKSEAYDKEKATLSETLRAYREQELQKAYEELSQFAQTCEQELQKVQQTKMGELQEKVLKAVQEVGAAGGFAYILPANGVAYVGTSAIDITDQVKAKVGAK
ncbi:MAG: OmpH family outer membrane protein [Bacteroidaceae bacterium]|jgi:outer membrane protein|nr:OmpH family outer membrane protein [Bacteroidaceae bacterium]